MFEGSHSIQNELIFLKSWNSQLNNKEISFIIIIIHLWSLNEFWKVYRLQRNYWISTGSNLLFWNCWHNQRIITKEFRKIQQTFRTKDSSNSISVSAFIPFIYTVQSVKCTGQIAILIESNLASSFTLRKFISNIHDDKLLLKFICFCINIRINGLKSN